MTNSTYSQISSVDKTDQPRARVVSRRTFLKTLGAFSAGAAGAALLSACTTPSSSATSVPAPTTAPTTAATTDAATATTPAEATTEATAAATKSTAASGSTDAKIVATAEAFVATLSDAQKSSGIFDFNDDTQRARWSNFPTGIFQRAGLRMGDLEQAQRDTVMAMLASILSTKGYQQVVDNVAGDEMLKGEGSGGNLIFGKDEYHISLLGTPSATAPWMVQFGGHHLAINATIVGANITLAPSLTGGQPINYTLDGKTVRQLGDESDKAFALIGMLDATQQSQAVLGSRVIDLVLGPGNDGKSIQPEGIKGSALNEVQQTALLDLINERVGLLNDANATPKMVEIKTNLGETYLAWFGPTTSGGAAYWRVQGPTFFMEFSPQQMGGSATNHIHAMYRETSNDYGVAWR